MCSLPCLVNASLSRNVTKPLTPCCGIYKQPEHVLLAFSRPRQLPAARTRPPRCSPGPDAVSSSSLESSHSSGPKQHGPCGGVRLAGSLGVYNVLLQLWRRLCAVGVAAARFVLITTAFWTVSLLPRPAPSLAASWRAPAAAATTAAVTATHEAAEGSRAACSGPSVPQAEDCPLRGIFNGQQSALRAGSSPAAHLAGPGPGPGAARKGATPLADLSAATVAGSNSPRALSSPAVTSSPLRSESRSSSGSRAYDAGPASSQNAAPSAPPYTSVGGASATFLNSTGGNGGNGGGLNGPVGSSVSSSGGAAAAAAPGGVLVADPEEAALAQQLGVGLLEAGVIRLFERNRASVVNISGMRAMQTFTTLDVAKMPYGQGSGFIWGEKGHVVTCYHLVKGAAEVKVTLYDNTSYTAKVLGYDAAKNLAVLKLSIPKSKLRDLQPVTLGSAAGLRVGQTVYGIGNPWGLGHTLSRGMVSGLGLELSAGLFPIKGVIVADSASDSGSSGGVLLDSQGALVGMLVTPPASSGGGGGGAVGRSFAVPIDAVRGLISQILAYGRTVRPALGITMAPAQVLERVGVEGVLVLEVPPGSPAHSAGLRHTHRDIFGDLVLGDIIVGLDGKVVRSSSDVYDILDEHRVGDRIKLDVVRDGKQAGLTVTLGERLLGAVEE